MFILSKGTLSMENYDLDHIKDWIDEGYSPKEALKLELNGVGIDIKNVISIELNGEQLANKNYCDIYSKIVCDFLNNN